MSFQFPISFKHRIPPEGVAEGNPAHWTSVYSELGCIPMGNSKPQILVTVPTRVLYSGFERKTAVNEGEIGISGLLPSLLFPGIFGQKLEDTVRYEKRYGNRLAPMLVEQCVDFIRQRGLKEEGLFRLPGQANLVKELQDAFDCGEKPAFDRYVRQVTIPQETLRLDKAMSWLSV